MLPPPEEEEEEVDEGAAWAFGAGSPGWEVSVLAWLNLWNRNAGRTYHALHIADEQTVENVARLVGVADILEGLGAILASDIEQDLLTTTTEKLEVALEWAG